MLSAYWERRTTHRAWDQWIEAVNSQWPVTFTRKSPLLQNTNGTNAYEYGQEFSVRVDAPSWIQARKYIEECLKPIFTDQYIIHPAAQDGGISKIGEELAQMGGDAEAIADTYQPSYPEIQFGASGRDETIGVIRIDISDSQLKAVIEQARSALANDQTLFSPRIPLQSDSSRPQLETAVQQVRNGEKVVTILDLSDDGEDSEPATTSLVFLVSDSGARQLGSAIETIERSESEAESNQQMVAAETALVYPELVSTHTQDLIDLGTAALDINGQGVIGAIPSDDVPIDLDWVRNYGPPDPSIEALGFRSNFLQEDEKDETEADDEGFLDGVTEDEDQNRLQNPEIEQVQEEIDADSEEELSEYRISIELDAEDILAEQFDESYVDDVPINNFEKEDGGLHIPNPEFCLFIDVALNPEQEDELRERLEEVDITERSAEIAVLKAPIEPNSIHQDLIIGIFPHFKLVRLRNEVRPIIEDVGGVIHTEELPYFVKYSAKEPYYITQDVSSLSNPERKLTDEEHYYNKQRIELIKAETDYRRILDAENLRLSLTEIKLGVDA